MNNDYLFNDNKNISLQVRKELKEHGFKTRDFKVSVRDAGYSTSLYVTIKNPCINKKDIETMLLHFENYEWDNRTYEILQGCNVYLFVNYDYGIFDEASQKWAQTAMGLMKSKEEVIRIFDNLFLHNSNGKLEILQQDSTEHCRLLVHNFKHLCELLYKYETFKSISV